MKKNALRIATIMMALVFALTFASCGGGSGLEGEWKAVKVSAFGTEMDPAEADMEMTLNLKSGGKGTFSSGSAAGSGEASSDITWEETEDGIKITVEGEEITGKLNDDKQLVLDIYGIEIIMEK